ncbi:Outer membrane protein OmpA [Flavobacteriaceae bacterium MAR_2010_188]|nr:Outer membrane protein OmpA [Flavobacteriaceae bacterium MAR_2010_188]
MKTHIKQILTVMVAVLFLYGCSATKNANNKEKGAVIGAAGGAVIGGVIGNNVGSKSNTVLGAIIGAAVGGAAGGYIGDRMDRQAEKIEQEIPGAKVERVGEGINVTFDENSGVYFGTNKYNVNDRSAETLTKLANIFMEYPNSDILVEGHTDNVGADDYNMGLSRRRAEAVSSFLVGKSISSGRITTNWYGENQPVGDNSTATGRAQNRRVELGIVANEALKKEAQEKAN